MLSTLARFDPISFLGLDTSKMSDNDKIKLKNNLNDKIGEYVLMKLSTDLDDEQLDQITKAAGEYMLKSLRNYIPDFDKKLMQEIENFKTDFQTVGGYHAT